MLCASIYIKILEDEQIFKIFKTLENETSKRK